jgi:hypothetical protein
MKLSSLRSIQERKTMYQSKLQTEKEFMNRKDCCLLALWDVASGTQRHSHVNFYNRYLLLLEEEYTVDRATRVCGNW